MADRQKVELRKGLKDVYFDRTTASLIVAKPGRLYYRGYNIDDLARYSTFEETCYLLIYGALPTVSQLERIDAELRANRELPEEVVDTLKLYRNAHPMDALRGAVSAMALADPAPDDLSDEAVLKKALKMTSTVATMVAAHHRIRNGNEPVEPNSDLAHAANFLYMLHGETPSAEDARLIDKDMVLHAEHGSNASTFAARVAASTRADFYSALTAAVSVLKGPKHGGAAEGAMRMAQEVGTVENAESYVSGLLADGQRVVGLRPRGIQRCRPQVGPPQGGRQGPRRKKGRDEVVLDHRGHRRYQGDEASRQARHQPQRRPVVRSRLLAAGNPGRPVRSPVCGRPNAGMGVAHNRAVLEEGHPTT